MNDEPKRGPGRPKRTLTNDATAGAPPVASDVNQADAHSSDIEHATSAEPIEAVVENPTDVGFVENQMKAAAIMTEVGGESPVEKKIHQLVEDAPPPGWQTIDTAPKNGDRIIVSTNGSDPEAVYWQPTRMVDKKNLRYVKSGKWNTFLGRMAINYEPKYWHPYQPDDYIAMSRTK